MGEGGSISEKADPHWPQLLLCVVLAPVLSAIFYGLAGRLAGSAQASVMLSPLGWMLALFYGFLPTLLFGSVGCALGGRFLSRAPWPAWGAAGGLAASAYVAVSLAMGGMNLGVGWFAPWATLLLSEDGPALLGGSGSWAVPLCIVLTGFVAGALYRGMSKAARATRG